MSSQNDKSPIYTIIALPVALIIVAGFAISSAAVLENLRFIKAADQILSLVKSVRSLDSEQQPLALAPGEDVWADLVKAGLINTSTEHTNAWNGEVRVIANASAAMRIESDLPAQDCRRLALYFLKLHPKELGLSSMEAQSFSGSAWNPIYPLPIDSHANAAEAACGNAATAHLALTFGVR